MADVDINHVSSSSLSLSSSSSPSILSLPSDLILDNENQKNKFDQSISNNNEQQQQQQLNKLVCKNNNSNFSYLNPFSWLRSNTDVAIEEIESKMFKCLKTPIERFYVNIRNNSLKIWTMSANLQHKTTPIVLVHGFCGGIGMWVHNVDALCESHPFYAFDLLGFGRSSRPPFSSDPIVAETQFVESIEDWRKELGLNEMILLGHSFGGYLSASYALRYPQYVKALILADPWGFPEHSNESKPDIPMPLWVSAIALLSQYVSPLSIFRITGQVGVHIFKTIRPDFKRKYMNILDNPDLVYSYLYEANNSYPSGEAGFRAVAKYFGFAKNPMIKRIDKINTNIPIWFIYGSRSWVDCTAGFSAVYIRQRFAQVAPVSVEIISGAGHHVYADKPHEFNEYIKYVYELIDELDNEQQQQQQQQQIINSDQYQQSNCSSNSITNCN